MNNQQSSFTMPTGEAVPRLLGRAGVLGRLAPSQALGSMGQSTGRVGAQHAAMAWAVLLSDNTKELKETWETRQPQQQLHGNAGRQAPPGSSHRPPAHGKLGPHGRKPAHAGTAEEDVASHAGTES